MISAPPDGTLVEPGQPVSLTATAEDAEDGDITSTIGWESNLDGPLGIGGSLSIALQSGTHRITASVTDTVGNTVSDEVSVTVNTVPTVSITAPADGANFDLGTTVDLTATATDAEDDNATLTAAISWTSSRDGGRFGFSFLAGAYFFTTSSTSLP